MTLEQLRRVMKTASYLTPDYANKTKESLLSVLTHNDVKVQGLWLNPNLVKFAPGSALYYETGNFMQIKKTMAYAHLEWVRSCPFV